MEIGISKKKEKQNDATMRALNNRKYEKDLNSWTSSTT